MRTVKALVTSAGSSPAVAVINALKCQKEIPIDVTAVDMNPLSAGFYLSDRYFTVPAASDPEFIPIMVSICNKQKIEILFPIIDEELLTFAENRHIFEREGVRVITNAPEVVRIAKDKYETYRFCLRHDILVPATFLPHELQNQKSLNFPLIIKPRSGKGTANVFKLRDARELDFFINYVPNPIVQEFIDGEEHTIDILTDFDGRILSVVPKRRIETKAGMQVKGKTIMDSKLLGYGKMIAEKIGLAPRANIQCIVSKDGIYLIEVNPKFPSSLPFTVAAGVNAPLLLVKMHLGKKVDEMMGNFKDGLIMLRCWQEIFVEA